MKAKIVLLQAELYKPAFFSVMRNRLRLRNLPKCSDHLKLKKDLQRELQNEVPKGVLEEGDWELPIVIE